MIGIKKKVQLGTSHATIDLLHQTFDDCLISQNSGSQLVEKKLSLDTVGVFHVERR